MCAFRKLRRASLPGLALIGSCWLVSGCATETVFQSDFKRFAGLPPIGSQAVGTTAIDPQSDQYVTAGTTQLRNDVRIARADPVLHIDPVPRAAVICNFKQFEGDGTYVFSTLLTMRSGAGAATIQFEPFGQRSDDYDRGFLHLDFMPDDTVRIDDDDATRFGTFPRDQLFIVQVTLKIDATPTAHILLSGAGASGEKDYTILPPFVPLARQYGAVRLWQGLPWSGFFLAADIVVGRKP
jgi:hypothetical protein